MKKDWRVMSVKSSNFEKTDFKKNRAAIVFFCLSLFFSFIFFLVPGLLLENSDLKFFFDGSREIILAVAFLNIVSVLLIYYADYFLKKVKTKISPVFINGLIYLISILAIVFLSQATEITALYFAILIIFLIGFSAFLLSDFEYLLTITFSLFSLLVFSLRFDNLLDNYPLSLIFLEERYILLFFLGLIAAFSFRILAFNLLKIEAEKSKILAKAAELEEDKKEIRDLLESLFDGMFVVDAQNRITFYNRAALKILGLVLPPERVIGKDINEFLPTIGENGPEPITKEAYSNLRQIIRRDFRVVSSEKAIRLYTNVTPVIADRELKGAIIFFRDITEEKNLEEQRAEFNAIASHELRTPLSVIEGYLFYILDPSSKLKYDKETKEYVIKAHQAAKNLNRLVTDILTVVKAENKELEVNLKKIDLKKFVKDIVGDFEEAAKKKNIKLEYRVTTSKVIPPIISDPVKIKEALSNLIDNALKFTEKGSVKVELGLLKNEAIVSVIDTGVGIAKEDLRHVYNKFFRAENWQTRKTSGTGLGLYIVKTLIERLGGRVGAQSSIGEGSRFYFTIPLEYNNEDDLKNVSKKELSELMESI